MGHHHDGQPCTGHHGHSNSRHSAAGTSHSHGGHGHGGHSHSHGAHDHSHGGHGHSHGGHGHSHGGHSHGGHGHSHGGHGHSHDGEPCGGHGGEDERQEQQHFEEVVQSFADYAVEALTAVREFSGRVLSVMPREERDLLELDGKGLVDNMAAGIRVNQEICDLILEGYGVQASPQEVHVHGRNISKVRSTLKQIVREWSSEGEEDREKAFRPLIDGLLAYLPKITSSTGKRARVLCPGCGLGRLVFEVCKAGYSCQGNEFSYHMLLGANLMLNCGIDKESLPVFPSILGRGGRKHTLSQFEKIQFPDVAVHECVFEEGVQMSMTAGEFVEAYSGDVGSWDGLATCFFIDTAKNVLMYIRMFAQMIRTGGVWTNVGPLLYHFADSYDDMSLELSWVEVKKLIARYFEIKEEKEIICKYTCSSEYMENTVYRSIYFVAVRNETPVHGRSNPVYP